MNWDHWPLNRYVIEFSTPDRGISRTIVKARHTGDAILEFKKLFSDENVTIISLSKATQSHLNNGDYYADDSWKFW